MQKNSKYMIFKHKELVDACALNDKIAQMKIYNLYFKAMYNTSYHIVNDKFVAEDIMQDAFIDVFNKVATFEWRSSFGSWLKRIVVNKSIDFIKKNKKTISLSEEMENYNAGIIEEDDEFFDCTQCKLEDIKQSIESLSSNYRTILVLHLFDGYDHQEISQILDISYNSVRVRYMRARRILVEKISPLINNTK